MPSWFGMYIMPFLFMGLLKDYLLLPWFGLVVCQSSCPFQRCECRLPSNGSWSALASPLWWVKPDRWTDRCRLLLPSDSAGSACSPTTSQISYQAGSCGLYSSSHRSLSLFLSFISLCPVHLFTFLKYFLLCLLLSLYPSTTQPQGMSSMDPLALCQTACALWGEWLFGGFV